MDHDDTDAFNSLLQLCRPRTDNPQLLKAIASLVQLRTVLLDMLYVNSPYFSLNELLLALRGVDMARGTSIDHLKNVQSSFLGLRELFEKETRSPGIRSCYDLVDICTHGVFVLKASARIEQALVLELPASRHGHGAAAELEPEAELGGPEPEAEPEAEEGAESAERGGDGGSVVCESFEYLQDLRSKLIMLEIPAELEAEIPHLKQMIESFSEQLQVLTDMRDAVLELYSSGHFAYQSGYEERHCFAADQRGMGSLRGEPFNPQNHVGRGWGIRNGAVGAARLP